jgi:hypothetical protein
MRIITLYGDESQRQKGRKKLALPLKDSCMNYQVMPERGIVFHGVRSRRISLGYRFPSVSIFMPFEPKMVIKNKLTLSLSKAVDKVVSELRDKHPGEMSVVVLQKLRAIIKNLNFNTHKKSLAIFVSPVFEKVYYLNIEVEEKIIVNESLQIRDLLHSKKQSQHFHILLLDEKESRIYLSDTHSSLRIIPGNLVAKNAVDSRSSEQAEFSSDIPTGNDSVKFLQKVDYSLDLILKRDRLPVFVIGAEKIVEKFKKITKNDDAIVEYVPGYYEESSLEHLTRILKRRISDWQKIQQKNLLAKLKDASNRNQLSFGIEDVRHEVINRRGQLLLMEKKYLYDSGLSEAGMTYDSIIETYNKFSCTKNPIDEMIEKVLENGGDVEFVNNGLLSDYCQIALIKD